MAMTAAIINIEDARRARTEQLDVRLSHLVTNGDEKKGLITTATDPKAIEYIRSLLANADFAMQGVRRAELGDMARTNSLWMQIGPYCVFYNLCLKRSQAEIESVDARSSLHPKPQPRKLAKGGYQRLIDANHIGNDRLHAQFVRGNGIAAAVIALACLTSIVFILSQNGHRIGAHPNADQISKRSIESAPSSAISARSASAFSVPDVNELMTELNTPPPNSVFNFATGDIFPPGYGVGDSWQNSYTAYRNGLLFGPSAFFTGQMRIRNMEHSLLQSQMVATGMPIYLGLESTAFGYFPVGYKSENISGGLYYSEGLLGVEMAGGLAMRRQSLMRQK